MRSLNIPAYRFRLCSGWFCSPESRRDQKRIFPFVLLSLVFLASQLCSAQDLDNVTIAGQVTDQNGAVIPGATVTATIGKTRVGRTVVADGDGHYKIIQLEPGIYSVKASFAGFAAPPCYTARSIKARKTEA